MANIDFKDTVTINGVAPAPAWQDTDGKGTVTATLNDNTGDEIAVDIGATVNKSASGKATALRLNITDTLSPDAVNFITGLRGANQEFYVRSGDSNYPGVGIKTFTTNAGWASFNVDNAHNSGWLNLFQNGSATSNALGDTDSGLYYIANGHNGFKFLTNAPGSYCYGAIAAHALRLGESGGASAVDVGIRRYGSSTAQIFDGNVNSPSTAKLMVTELVAPDGSPTSITFANDGDASIGVSLTIASAAKVVWDTNVVEYADTVTLVDESATPLFDLAIADGQMMGGEFTYTICASDGTDHQAISGDASFAAVRKAGTPETYYVDVDEHLGTDSTAVSTGTLTDSFSIAGASGKITVSCTANSSLAGATITCRYKLTAHTSNAITKK